MMMGHFASKLMTKFGLNNNQANNVSGNLIPDVLANLINKSNDPNESGFSLENLLGSITGNKGNTAGDQNSGGGIGDLLKQLGGRPGQRRWNYGYYQKPYKRCTTAATKKWGRRINGSDKRIHKIIPRRIQRKIRS